MFHPDFIQAELETNKVILYGLSNNSISPLQIWWLNIWNISSGMVTMLNHTYLRKVAHSEEDYDKDDESIGESVYTFS